MDEKITDFLLARLQVDALTPADMEEFQELLRDSDDRDLRNVGAGLEERTIRVVFMKELNKEIKRAIHGYRDRLERAMAEAVEDAAAKVAGRVENAGLAETDPRNAKKR